jgi:hypothetical protein
VKDPFRRGLGYAIQWHDALRVAMNQQVDAALQVSAERIEAGRQPPPKDNAPSVHESLGLLNGALATPPNSAKPGQDNPAARGANPHRNSPTEPSAPTPTNLHQDDPFSGSRAQCARILQQRCPACFGGSTFGRSFNE